MPRSPHRRPAAAAALLLAGGLAAASPLAAGAPAAAAPGAPAAAAPQAAALDPSSISLELVGQELFATGTTFEGTEVGGLSGLTRAGGDTYLALSDDRGDFDPARFYTLSVDLGDGRLDEGDVRFTDVTTLTRPDGTPFPTGSLDPEGIAAGPRGLLAVTSEGDAANLVDPFVGVFRRDGRQVGTLPLPEAYLPVADGSRGVRTNLAFESATATPDHRYFFTATENALAQDGPAASTAEGSPSRLLRYDLRTGRLDRTVVYPVEPIAAEPVPPGAFATNGLVELLAVDGHRLAALERSFSVGVGNAVSLYAVDTSGATDVTGLDSLADHEGEIVPARKTLLLDLGTLGITLDNIEGMVLGPVLPDGRPSLLLVSDNNFSGTQFTQFLAFAVSLG